MKEVKEIDLRGKDLIVRKNPHLVISPWGNYCSIRFYIDGEETLVTLTPEQYKQIVGESQ